MNPIDLISLILLALFGFYGYKKGLIYSVFVSARFLFSVIVTQILMTLFSESLLLDPQVNKMIVEIKSVIFRKIYLDSQIIENINPNIVETLDYYVLFVMLFIIISLVAVVASIVLKPAVKTGIIREMDKFLGSLFGCLRFILISMLAIFIMDKVPDSFISFDTKEMFSESIYLKYIYIFNIFIYFFG